MEGNHNKLSSFEYDKLGNDRASLKRSLSNRLIYSLGKDPITATHRDWFHTTAYAVRERLIERWMETMRSYYRSDAKRVYYLSMEFLTGRLLSNSLLNMGFYEECREALADLGAGHRPHPRTRDRRGPGQRRARPARRLLPRFHGDPAPARLRLRHPLRVRHVQPAHRERLPDRAPRQLAAVRQSLGVPPSRGALPGEVRRPRGAVQGRRGAYPLSLGRHGRRDGHGLRHAGAGLRYDAR